MTGVSDTVSRRRVFICRPTAPTEEAPCAEKIVRHLATTAFRRPVSGDEVKGLVGFYESGRKKGDFESGVREALQAVLASPQFIFRLERAPAGVKPGQNYRITDIDLASRLSYFLWSTVPDKELVDLAMKSQLRAPGVLDAQVKRMLADPRSEDARDALRLAVAAAAGSRQDSSRRADLSRVRSLPGRSDAARDRAVLRDADSRRPQRARAADADWTFVNERLARHYGIPNIIGDHFRRVQLADENRRGLLGQGSILMMTSVADRTSPVLRGKWVMEVLMASPPPAPPRQRARRSKKRRAWRKRGCSPCASAWSSTARTRRATRATA